VGGSLASEGSVEHEVAHVVVSALKKSQLGAPICLRPPRGHVGHQHPTAGFADRSLDVAADAHGTCAELTGHLDCQPVAQLSQRGHLRFFVDVLDALGRLVKACLIDKKDS
jgi:hypothetical protein